MAVNNNSGCGTWIVIAFVGAVVWQCARDKAPVEVEADYSSYSSPEASDTDYSTYSSLSPIPYVVEDPVTPEAQVSSGYQDAGTPYGCTDDCSGHDAGWAWAEENAVTDPGECGGNSMSFEEGCIAYAEEQEADRPDEDRW